MSAGAGARDRTRQGLFAVLYRDKPLLRVIGEVVRVIDPERPEQVSQPIWDRKRARVGGELGYPDLPTASGIYQRFNRVRGPDGKARLPWRRILELAVSESDPTQALAASTRSAEDDFDVRHLWLGMRLVENELGVDGLSRRDYTLGFERLTQRRTRSRDGVRLVEVLPTLGQIEQIARSVIKAEREAGITIADPDDERDVWAKANELSGLQLPEQKRPPPRRGHKLGHRGQPIPFMLHHYVEANPALPFPSHRVLRLFAERLGMKLEAVRKGESYAIHVEQVRRERAEQGLDSPPDPPHAGRNTKPPDFRLPAEPIDAFELEPGAGWDHDSCIEALREYERLLPTTERGSEHHYGTHRRPEWPAVHTIQNYCESWAKAWAEAQRRNQAERLAGRGGAPPG